MCPSPVADNAQRGFVIPIGGAEEKLAGAAVLQRFVDLCGGKRAHIVVIPTASRLEDTGDVYTKVFTDLGAGKATSLTMNTREDAARADNIDALERATGVFITGGNQLRLSTILGGTGVFQRLRKLNAGGVHIAGTSAGAAIMPEHMIAGGKKGLLPRQNSVKLAPGLGLTNAMIIDQHFSQRSRLGRLLTAVSYNPFLLGVGLDEDTGVFIGPDDVLEVIGSGGITIVDAGELSYSSMDSAERGDALTMIGLKMHFLAHGGRYDLQKRSAFPPSD